MWYNYLVPPLLGAVIGYLTNDLAIRMLFRPHQPKYIWGHKIPFTPGIIPKEKSRLAHSIGEMVSVHLMDKDTLSKNLLSDEMVEKIDECGWICGTVKSESSALEDLYACYGDECGSVGGRHLGKTI